MNAAQAIIATLVFRVVENERKRPKSENPPVFLPYASHYIAMLVGQKLLEKSQIKLEHLDHRHFFRVKQSLEANSDVFIAQAIQDLKSALIQCYGNRDISLQQLSATFRRGDLLEML